MNRTTKNAKDTKGWDLFKLTFVLSFEIPRVRKGLECSLDEAERNPGRCGGGVNRI